MLRPKEKPKLLPTTFTADEELLRRVDDEMAVRRVHNRSAVIRALIEEALYRASVRRKTGKSVELGASGNV